MKLHEQAATSGGSSAHFAPRHADRRVLIVDALVSEQAAARLNARFEGVHRLVQLSRTGDLRVGARPVGLQDVRLEVAWLTPDVLMDHPFTTRFIDLVLAAGTVQWVQSAAAGTDITGFDRLAGAHIQVCNSHANAASIAEFVFASVLEHYQMLEQRHALQRDRTWAQYEFREILATTWLVIGLGATGSAVARRATTFGATVLGVRRTPVGDEPVHELVPAGALHEHLHRADVIVLTVPANRATHHLVDASFLGRVREGAVLLNVSRGSIVDETALLRALDEGRPELAVLDTTSPEPLPVDSPLWGHPRVRITCHSAALGAGRLARGTELFAENLSRHQHGLQLLNSVAPSTLLGDATDTS